MPKRNDETPLHIFTTEEISAALKRRQPNGEGVVGVIENKFKSTKIIIGAVVSVFLAGAGFTTFIATRVASKADIVDAVKEHASKPHPLSEDERAALAAEKKAHEDEIVQRGVMSGKLDSVLEQNSWLTRVLWQSERLKLPANDPPPKPKKEK